MIVDNTIVWHVCGIATSANAYLCLICVTYWLVGSLAE